MAPGEPVAWGVRDRDGRVVITGERQSYCDAVKATYDDEIPSGRPHTVVPLYAAPPAPPVAESVRDALAKVDVEPVDMRDTGQAVYEVVGLKEVEAAHRAEVERAVAEERAATLPLLCDAVLRVQSCITRSAELEKEYADGGYTEANAVCRRQREEDEALLMRMDAAIRARGGAK